jgi:hypothetical protein
MRFSHLGQAVTSLMRDWFKKNAHVYAQKAENGFGLAF